MDINQDIIEHEIATVAESAERTLIVAREFIIESDAMYSDAAEQLKKIKGLGKEVDALRKSLTKPLDDEKAAIMARFKAPTGCLDEAEATIKRAMGAYQSKKEAEERQRQIEYRAEQERMAREVAAKQAEAQKLAAAGDAEAAKKAQEDSLQAQIAAIAVIPQAVEAPKVSGISMRKTWKARVTDKAALIAAVAAGKVPGEVVTINESVLNTMARALGGALNYPGVEAYEEQTIASRAA